MFYRLSREKKIIFQKGGFTLIDVSTLTEEERAAILAARAYKKAWRKKNKDKVKAANARFYKKLAAKPAKQEIKQMPPE